MHSPEEGETPVKILSNIRSTISSLQRLESSIVRQQEQQQKQQQQQQLPSSVNSTSTQTEKETPLLGAKPDVSYYRQSKLMAQYQELAGVDGVLRQVVSEVVSSEEVQTSTLTGSSSSRKADGLSPLSPAPPPAPPSLASLALTTLPSNIGKQSPPQVTSPISPSPCAPSKGLPEVATPTVISAACSPRSSGSDSQITVPQFLIYSTRSLSQSTNVTSFESTDSGLAGESFEAYSPEPPLTIDLGADVVATTQALPLPQSLPPAETSSKEHVRQSLKQLVTGNLAAPSSTMMHLKVEPSTDSEVARLLQSTSTTFTSTQKRRKSIIEELPEHYKHLRASSSTHSAIEQLKILQLQKSSLAAGVVLTTRGSKVGGQICSGGALSDQHSFAWPQVPLPPPTASQSLIDVRKGQLRRQETIADLKGHTSTWPTSPLPPSSTVPLESARSPCRQTSCKVCGPAFLEQQLHWQRSSRSNSLPVQKQTLVDPALNILRRASAPVSVTGILGQASHTAMNSSQYRRGSSHQLLPALPELTATSNLSSQAAATSQLHHQSIQHHQGLQTHTIYYNTQQEHHHHHHHHQQQQHHQHHQHQSMPSSMSISMAASSLVSSQTQPTVNLTTRPSPSLIHPQHHHHQQQQHQSSPPTSQHPLRSSPSSAVTAVSQSSVGGSCSAGPATVHSSLPLPCIVTGCHQILVNQVALAEHLQVKHNQPLYWCCGDSYTISAFLQEHIHRRHRSDPICQHCGRIFAQAKALWEHLSSSQCEQLTIGEQTAAAAVAGQRYVKCNWIGCNWSGIDQARHHQRVHLRLMNKYTRLDGLPPPPPPPGASGAQGTSGI